MARYVLSTASALLLALLFLLAAGGRQPRVAVLEGNYDFARGDLARAIRHYRGAVRAGSQVAAYNLANARLAVGETDAGLDLLQRIPADVHPELRRRVAFNLGHAHYRAGRYREAALHFRDALALGPESMDARVNLELALRRMHAGQTRASPAAVTTPDDGTESELFKQLRALQTTIPALPQPGAAGGY
ncbi:MAG: tetratricopeptide repeat protein [Spirochaetaceae bacterium]|nr:tetratricopeptide repeat protein [Spirochaetaceae bacterium]